GGCGWGLGGWGAGGGEGGVKGGGEWTSAPPRRGIWLGSGWSWNRQCPSRCPTNVGLGPLGAKATDDRSLSEVYAGSGPAWAPGPKSGAHKPLGMAGGSPRSYQPTPVTA